MPSYSVCAASRPGSKHNFAEENNQDAYALRRLDDGIVMVVSDGAGSQPYSRIGADIVAAATAAFLARMDWSAAFAPQAGNFLASVQAELAAGAAKKNLTLRDLACTVVALAATSRGVRALQIGDGFIVTRMAAEDSFKLLFPITKGEHANETAFVTQSDAAEHLLLCEKDQPPQFICLSSDGVERQAIRLRESEPHAPFFDYLAKVAASEEGKAYLEKFLAMPSLDQVTDDDRTLVCAVQISAQHDQKNRREGE